MNQPREDPRYRHEWKHVISASDAAALRRRLAPLMRHDPYHPGPYHIRSLYFDNPYDTALREKLDGLSVREKFRIRYYDDDETYIRVEKKSKFNTLCGKLLAPISKEQCLRLLDGDIAWMPQAGEALLTELYAKMRYQLLRPRTLVDYVREAFVYNPGNVRITIDSSIRTGLSATALFDRTLPTIPADDTNPTILEVKYDEFLPSVLYDLIQIGNRRTTSFSKYAACRLVV